MAPNLRLSQASKRLSSYSSSSPSSSISAESMRVFVPVTMESMNATTPRKRGIFVHLPYTLVGTVLIWISSFGRRTARAVFFSPFIMMPSITACPPIFVGQASFKKILLKSMLYYPSNLIFLITSIKVLLSRVCARLSKIISVTSWLSRLPSARLMRQMASISS